MPTLKSPRPAVRFSTRTTYGLKALVDLALHEGLGPIAVASVAKRQGIPASYLEQLLHRLRRAGLVVAERGARGGYQLGRSPAQISVADLVAVLEAMPRRRARFTPSPLEAGVAVDQAARLIWARMDVAVGTALAATTLAELAAEARRRHATHAIHHPFTFHI